MKIDLATHLFITYSRQEIKVFCLSAISVTTHIEYRYWHWILHLFTFQRVLKLLLISIQKIS